MVLPVGAYAFRNCLGHWLLSVNQTKSLKRINDPHDNNSLSRVSIYILYMIISDRITTTIKLGTRVDREQSMDDKINSVNEKLI